MSIDIDALVEQAEQIDWDTVSAEFAARWEGRYSHRNLQLLFFQCPTATQLHTYKGWLAEGRQVRKGETSIRLFAPKGKVGEEKPEGEDKRKPRIRPISLFDISQTDPIEKKPELKEGN